MRCFVNAFCLCALTVGGVLGQTDRGTITGTVTDPSGAVVPTAKVSAENADTHNVVTTVTSDTGNYTLGQVPVGVWDVTVEAPGFKRFRSLRNTIEVAKARRPLGEWKAIPGFDIVSIKLLFTATYREECFALLDF